MNKAESSNRLEIRRILVTVDASAQSLVRIESAAELAAILKAELIGLFVEDANLLRIAELPFAMEFSLSSPIGRRIRREHLQYQLRAQSERMHQALAAAASARGVPWEFKVARGLVTSEVLSEAAQADMLILGKATWAPRGGKRLGSTVRMILTQGRGLTLIVQEKTSWAVPVSVIFSGSDLSAKALCIAARLSKAEDRRLNVFILASDRETALKRRSMVLQELAESNLVVDFHIAVNPSLNSLAWLVKIHARGPLVLSCSEKLLQGEELCSLVNEVSNPIFLIR
jgi:nucleotide-binding universal stress UspA family protein